MRPSYGDVARQAGDVETLTSSKLDKPSMQARKSGHTTHHSGDIARTEWCGPMRRTHRASTHAASADVYSSVAPYFSL